MITSHDIEKIKSSIPPFIEPEIKAFLQEKESEIVSLQEGVTHIVFPEIVSKRVQEIKTVLGDIGSIYFPLKSTISISLIKQIHEEGCGLEVSTLGELDVALTLGSQKILAGGPKNKSYLKKALEHKCLISVDSREELEYIQETNIPCEVLLRVSDLKSSIQHFSPKYSRFGIPSKDIATIVSNISKHITVRGIHFHSDSFNVEQKASFLGHISELLNTIQKQGHPADILNIGGGFNPKTLESRKDWLSFIGNQANLIKETGNTTCINNACYGLEMEHGIITNLKKLESKFNNESTVQQLKTLLTTPTENTTLQSFLEETEVCLIIEPGQGISSNAGITIIPFVQYKKDFNNNMLLITEGHLFSISSNMFDYVSNPLVLGPTKKESGSVFICGLLCREDDFIMDRQVYFEKLPDTGSALVFCNTGSYAMSYEQCNPQRHKAPKRLVYNTEKKQLEEDYDY